ncbi:MAG: transglutaminaseTgpA domain-containing protein [Fimbriimonadales bacterium]|nr:transglutaminaseTgpA domain-containing protein [Fimbriimonadales bacterium]
MALERTASMGSPPPIAAYGAVWLLTLASVLVVQLARVTEFSAMPFIVLLTLGVILSAWISRFSLSENTRFVLGVLDGALAFLCLMGQSYLNGLVGLDTDTSIETYLSLSFLWYLCLRSALMVSMSSLVFQSVPALALFGLIATYMLATQILWLFVVMLLAMLFLMLASHRMEWGQTRQLETGYALRTVFTTSAFTGLTAFLLAPLIALTVGQLISTIVVGMPFRAHMRPGSATEMPPELQAGAGAVALSKMEVMRVRLEGAVQPPYLRTESYNYYTGRGWNRGRVFYEEMRVTPQGRFVPGRPVNAPPSRQATATIRLSSGWHRSLYVPGYPLEIEAPVRYLYYVRPIGGVVSYQALGAGYSYTARAYWPPEDPRLLRQAPPASPRLPFQEPAHSRRRIPNNARRTPVAELVDQLTRRQPTQYDKVMALVRYIEQNTAYNLNVEAYPPDVDVVEYFLFEAKQGYCVEFATALAVMCLYADIPARVASGFILQERDPDTGEYIVREEHRHLWTEVYFEGIGWVAFDATRNAPVISAETLAEQQTDETTQHARRQWLQRMLDALIATMVLAILYLLVAPRFGWTRRMPVPRAQRLYRRLVFALRLRGIAPPAVGQTPRTYLQHAVDSLRQHGSEAAPLLDALTPLLLEYFYAAPPRSAALEPEVAQQTARVQHQILQELGAGRLILRLIDMGRQKVYGG